MKHISIFLIVASVFTIACETKKPSVPVSVMPAKPVEKGTVIAKLQLREGLKFEVSGGIDVDSILTEELGTKKQDIPMKETLDFKATVEILAISAGTASKVKVAFGEVRLTGDGVPTEFPLVLQNAEGKSAIEGQTYVVDMKEKPLVLDVNGRKNSQAKDVEKILNDVFSSIWFVDAMPIEVMVGDKVKSLSDAFQKHIEKQCRGKDSQRKDASPVGPKVTVQDAIVRKIENGVVTFDLAATAEGERAIGKGEENLNPWGKIEMGGVWTKGKIALTHPIASMVMTSKRDIRGVLKVETDGMPVTLEETDTLVAKSKEDPKGKRSVERTATEKRTTSWIPVAAAIAVPAPSAADDKTGPKK
jgi:hypothetical protein